MRPRPFPERVPEGMQASEVFLVIRIIARPGGLPLADPIDDPEQVGLFPQVPDPPVWQPFFRLFVDGDTFLTTSHVKNHADKEVKYGQIITPKFQGKEVPVLKFKPLAMENPPDRKRYVNHLLTQEIPGPIVQWTRGLAKKLPDLEEADLALDAHGRIEPVHHAKIARALCRHLAESGEFTYSLRLHRLGVSMDPTAEFLLKVKEGHCERYAAGLTLMLRSLAIPARIVRGYNGCDAHGKGSYVIRQDQAHSWVEALVPDKTGTKVWLQLDPTPSALASTESVAPFFQWAWTRIINPEFTWKSLIMDYNTDRQGEVGDQFRQLWNSLSKTSSKESTWSTLWGLVRLPGLALLCLAAALLANTGWRRWHRAGDGRLPPLSFHAQLLRVLEHCCQLRPQTGQTPLEFAHVARAALATRSPPPRWPICRFASSTFFISTTSADNP